MRRICAWCEKPMDGDPKRARPGEAVTHGICPECQEYFFGEPDDQSLDRFLDRLDVPVLVVDGEARVQSANRKAVQVLGADLPRVHSRLLGQVLECARARLPGGCGRTEHCPACVIRGSVESTYQTGEEHNDLVAQQVRRHRSGEGQEEVWLRISTRKSGRAVLLRVEQVESVPIEKAR